MVLSDMFDDLGSVLAGLKHLRYRRHEVVLMHVLDPAEIEFPFDRATLFVGLEEAGQVPADPPALRRAYLAEFGRYLRQLRAGCREQAIDYVLLRTDNPLDIALSNYLASRR